MVAIVHGILRRGRLLEFVGNNRHAASRALHHPGHRGSVDISSQLPFEHTSISLWKTYALAQELAYKPGGHANASSTRSRTRRTASACSFRSVPWRAPGRWGSTRLRSRLCLPLTARAYDLASWG